MESWSSQCLVKCLLYAFPLLRSIRLCQRNHNYPRFHLCDLNLVFSKQKAQSLPLHRPYDCAIDLLPGTPLLCSRRYKLSGPKRETMKHNIDDSLCSGRIGPSTSPVGARFLIVEKKDKTAFLYRPQRTQPNNNKDQMPLTFHGICF